MPFITSCYKEITGYLQQHDAVLVAVSKTKPVSDILEAVEAGQLDFGENYVQELLEKEAVLPKIIRWHFIGHLQTNKVKQIAPFVHLIHGVDSKKLLAEIDKQAAKLNKKIKCLLQVHIAAEETKFGFSAEEVLAIHPADYPHVHICGLMGMASFTHDTSQVQNEFNTLLDLFTITKKNHPAFYILSMGMSGDYKIALAAGSNMVRIGSLLFGNRDNTKK